MEIKKKWQDLHGKRKQSVVDGIDKCGARDRVL